MKKQISTILAICAMMVTTGAVAQDLSRGWSFGLKAGLNVAGMWHHGDDTDGKDQYSAPRVAGVYGVSGTYNFNEDISLGAEILYSQQGTRYKLPTNYDDYNDDTESYEYSEDCRVTYRLDYIYMPILFGYRFEKNIGLTFKIGIQPGFKISGSTKTKWWDSDGNKEVWKGDTSNLFDYNNEYEGDINDDYYLFDLCVPIGISYDINKKWSVEGRYTIGVLNTFDKPNDDDYDKDLTTTNKSFAITLGYKF